MPKTYRIKVDEEVFAQLQKQATPFVDEPNDVLRKILGLPDDRDGGVKEKAIVRKRIPSQSLLPLKEYRLSVLKSLDSHGGTAERKMVLHDVFGKLESRLNPDDLEKLNGRPPRWQVRAEVVRSHMAKDGLVESAGRGMWRITHEGRRQLTAEPKG
jgi:hypothetical protein